MPFTQQEEAQIRQNLHPISDKERQRHISNPQAFAIFAGSFLGSGFVNHLLNKHTWPEVERKLVEIIKGLPRL